MPFGLPPYWGFDMNTLTTRKVLPTHPSQGEWVVINAADFDPAVHTEYVAPPLPEEPALPPKKRGGKAAAAEAAQA